MTLKSDGSSARIFAFLAILWFSQKLWPTRWVILRYSKGICMIFLEIPVSFCNSFFISALQLFNFFIYRRNKQILKIIQLMILFFNNKISIIICFLGKLLSVHLILEFFTNWKPLLLSLNKFLRVCFWIDFLLYIKIFGDSTR